jgi:hypothetical protein
LLALGLKEEYMLKFHIELRQVSFKVSKTLFLLILISSIDLNNGLLMGVTDTQPTGLFSYEFVVDEEGFTLVNIIYRSDEEHGSSWVFVPKFSEWINHAVSGEVVEWSLRDTQNLTGNQYYFYEALYFSFKSDGSEFEMNIQFNFSAAAMIIEPEGIFYSPQIGFEKGNRMEAKVIFPHGFEINADEAIAFGSSGSYGPSPSESNSKYVFFDDVPEGDNLIRIEVGFKTFNPTAELLKLESGIFTFETVTRYAEYADEILNLFNKTYGNLVGLFNVTLENAEVKFFLPDFDSLFSEAAFVPFTAGRLGDIHINIVLTRYVRGYIEAVALHELVHHFLWGAGIFPNDLLWFHEGMAEYVGIEIANKFGYEGSVMMKQGLEEGIHQLMQTIGENLGYLKTPQYPGRPEDVGAYYIGAYYVVSRLAEPRGGLEYYGRFFRLMNGETVDSNAVLGYYLSLAANESVVKTMNGWGFGILDLYVFSSSLGDVEEVLDQVNPIFQPYKFFAELLYQQALSYARGDDVERVHLYLVAAVLVSRLAPLLTLVTFSGILFGVILWALKRKGVFLRY